MGMELNLGQLRAERQIFVLVQAIRDSHPGLCSAVSRQHTYDRFIGTKRG